MEKKLGDTLMDNLITYAIIDANGVCVNRIIWDGNTEWTPPDGCIAIPDPSEIYTISESTNIVFSNTLTS